MTPVYGTVTDGVWRSRFKVEWRRHLQRSESARQAQGALQASKIGQAYRHLVNDWTVKPFALLDRFVVWPALCTTSRFVDQIIRLAGRLSWLDFDCHQYTGRTPTISQVRLPDANGTSSPPATPSILTLVAQRDGLVTRCKGVLWKYRLISRPVLRWSVSHARHARRIYKSLGAEDFEISDVVLFLERAFLPKLLNAANRSKDPLQQAWLRQHVAPHIQTILRSFQSVADELYAGAYTDNLKWDLKPISVLYSAAHVKDKADQDPWSTENLPSVVVDVILRAMSDNPPDSPVPSGPKTVTMTMAVCLLPNAAADDQEPLYIQDALITGIDQLRV